METKISKSLLGITGEYCVAAELGKRNIYAQLTMGSQKKTDLLIFNLESNTVLKVEVKSKQGNVWPNCKGINNDNSLLVFVDFMNIQLNDRPTFYILNNSDWFKTVGGHQEAYLFKNPERSTEIKNNVLILHDEKNKYGKPYEGCSIKPSEIEIYKEDWDKVFKALDQTYSEDKNIIIQN